MNLYEILDTVHMLSSGDYAECGVYRGDTAVQIAERMNPAAELWLFDSFLGHAEPSEFDCASAHPKGRYADTSLKAVSERLGFRSNVLIVADFIDLDVRYRIPDAFMLVQDKQFRFVHIDLDHYLPTKAACLFFKPRMVKGGIIRFDDYRCGECPGATKAVDEVFGAENVLSGDYRWVCA